MSAVPEEPGRYTVPLVELEADARVAEYARDWYRRAAEREQRVKEQEAQGPRGAPRQFDQQSAEACPWRSRRVVLLKVSRSGVRYANTEAEKRAMLAERGRILVAWPGEWSQDVFELGVEGRKAAKAAL